MSIVNFVCDKLPIEGQVVYADNGDFALDRAVFSGGKFIGGGDFPVPEYEVKNVTKWVSFSDYQEAHKRLGIDSFSVSFDIAEGINSETK